MSDRRQTDPSPEELRAIQAELEALGEPAGDDLGEELQSAGHLATALEIARHGSLTGEDDLPNVDALEGLSVLRLSSAEADLPQERSATLLAGLQAMLSGDGVARELHTIGERPASDQEQGDAQLLGQVLDAWREGPTAVASLPDPAPEQLHRMSDAFQGLHRVRATSPEAELTPQRSEELLTQTHHTVNDTKAKAKAKVIDLAARFRRRMVLGASFAAAAAVLLMCGLGFVLQMAIGPTTSQKVATTTSEPVAQIELIRAEEHLAQAKADALRTLMESKTTPSGPQGDHYLREVRMAHHRAIQARSQARGRRL